MVFGSFHQVRRDAEHAAFSPFGTVFAVAPSLLVKDAGLVKHGHGAPAVATLRPGLRAPSWVRVAASSCGVYPCSFGHKAGTATVVAALPRAARSRFPRNQRPILPRAMRASPCRRRTSSITPKWFQAAPGGSRYPRATRGFSHRANGKVSGGQASYWLKLAAPGDLWFFPASGKERPSHPPICRDPASRRSATRCPCPGRPPSPGRQKKPRQAHPPGKAHSIGCHATSKSSNTTGMSSRKV